MSSPLPCTTVWRLVSGGPVTAAGVPFPYTLQDTVPADWARDISKTYICMGLQLRDWYRGFPTFRLWGGWCPSRRAMGGIACPSTPAAGGGLEEDDGGVPGGPAPLLAPPPGDTPCVWSEGDDDLFFTASRPRRNAAGETAPGGVRGEPWGGVWRPLLGMSACWASDGEDSQS